MVYMKFLFVEHPPHGKNNTSKFGDRGPSSNIYKSLVPNKVTAM